jgi:cytochrome c oxidase subunit 1
MGVSPILVVFGALYHWYPKMTGRMLDDTLGRIHFWITFIGTYMIYLPMYYLGILGVPRRYYAWDEAIQFIPPSVHTMNKWITVSALFVAAVQLVFLFNLVWSFFKGRPSGRTPGGHDAGMANARHAARTWQLARELPVVYRWAYDTACPAPKDFIRKRSAHKLAPAGHGH